MAIIARLNAEVDRTWVAAISQTVNDGHRVQVRKSRGHEGVQGLGDTHLVGLGAIGNGVIWSLARPDSKDHSIWWTTKRSSFRIRSAID